MTFGSLFAGIGGMDLGLERSGMQCSWQVEIDPYARRVLEKHWPGVRRHDDVRTFPPTDAEEWQVDLIAGGFPCQDISNAGERAGIDGERSGLWREYARIVRVLRPCFVLVENVSALLGRGLGRVLGDLAACGYDAEWDCLPAFAVGAPHERDRLFIVAHAESGGRKAGTGLRRDGKSSGRREPLGGREESRIMGNANGSPENAHAEKGSSWQAVGKSSWWSVEPAVGRMAYGVPNRVDRLRGLGNAVVPQVSEWIGRRIMEAAH